MEGITVTPAEIPAPESPKIPPIEVKKRPIGAKTLPIVAKIVPIKAKALLTEAEIVSTEAKTVPVEAKTLPIKAKALPIKAKTLPIDAKTSIEAIKGPIQWLGPGPPQKRGLEDASQKARKYRGRNRKVIGPHRPITDLEDVPDFSPTFRLSQPILTTSATNSPAQPRANPFLAIKRDINISQAIREAISPLIEEIQGLKREIEQLKLQTKQ
jgi:hypothetical protein